MIEQEFDTPSDALAHFGIKGMRWGVRKQENLGVPVPKNLVEKSITKTTKNGDVFTLSPQPTPALSRFINRYSVRARTNTANSSFMDIKDKSGKPIGALQIYRKKKDEVNVIWVDIDQSSRGKGYATAVMKSVQEIAKNDGAKKVTLEVPGISPDARHVYEKLGFKVTKNPKRTTDIWGGLTEMEYNVK